MNFDDEDVMSDKHSSRMTMTKKDDNDDIVIITSILVSYIYMYVERDRERETFMFDVNRIMCVSVYQIYISHTRRCAWCALYICMPVCTAFMNEIIGEGGRQSIYGVGREYMVGPSYRRLSG